MKIIYAGVWCSLILSSIGVANAATLDDELETWSRSSQNNSKEVIVYFYEQDFKDRSGLSRPAAIEEEKAYVRSGIGNSLSAIRQELGNQAELKKSLWGAQAAVMKVNPRSLRKLAQRNEIEAIIANKIVMLDEPIKDGKKVLADEGEMTYGLRMINAPGAWDQGYTGKGVRVGIIDSGMDFEHPDLKGKVLLSKDFTEDGNTNDRNGHGTHVAGTIAGGNASGTHIGVAPDAQLILAKIFDDRGGSDLATILAAMEWIVNPDGDPATDDAPRVVSNSWGANSQFILGFRNIVKTWRRFNIFPNFAAGNSGPRWMSTGAPARYPFAYAVAAVNETGKVTSFSSRGPSFWLRGWSSEEKLPWYQRWKPTLYTKPDIAAPGFKVYSSLPEGKYGRFDGTSMATPHVSGVIALGYQANPNLSVDAMMEVLNSSTIDKGKEGKDNKYGYGIIQADMVVRNALAYQGSQAQSFRDVNPSSWEWGEP